MIATVSVRLPKETGMLKTLEKIEVIPSGAALGAEIRGVDLRKVTDESFREIEQAWYDHLVLLIRDQTLSDEELMAFGSRFGELELPYLSQIGRPWMKDYPEILVVSNVKQDGKPIGALGNGEAVWHSDMTYQEIVPSASLLYALEVPETGGETGFSNLYEACETLPAALREKAADRLLIHDNAHNSAGELRIGFTEVTNPMETPGPRHPVICRHPKTQRDYLLLGRRPHEYVMGLELEESERLLDAIWAHATRPELAWFHHWRPGDVLIWDNRCTLHRREPFDADARRIMHRLQVKGERSVAST